MASTLIQFRTDDISKNNATDICRTIGIDLQDYLRMCVSRLISEKGIPFSMNADVILASRAKAAMREASSIAKENGSADITLEEINAEIDEARKAIRKK